METQLIILSAQKYKVTDEATKTTNEGVTLFAYPSGNLKKYHPQNNLDVRGRKPFKCTVPVDMWPGLEAVPGIYNCEIEMKTNSNLKAEMSIFSLEYVSEV